jgi:hypothetical protein
MTLDEFADMEIAVKIVDSIFKDGEEARGESKEGIGAAGQILGGAR